MRDVGRIDPLWAVKTHEFAHALTRAATSEQVSDIFDAAIARIGFHSFLIAAMDERDFSQRVLAKRWHPEWGIVYTEEKYNEADPVRKKILRAADPFLWSEARYACRRNKRARLVMDAATEFQMNQGFCAPIYDLSRPIASVSISGDKPDLGPGIKTHLHVISQLVYYKFRALLKPRSGRREIALTHREREVLKWVSVGKSDWAIGEILSISERTARAHVANAARKLNAPTRAAAACEAQAIGAI